MQTYQGRCHCGALAYELRTPHQPATWPIRACQCSFCRVHGARTTSGPDATVRFVIPDESKLHRYRFGSRTADFYVCHGCGAYVASVIDSPKGRFATLNVNLLNPPLDLPPSTPMVYDSETPSQKLARREQKWTPVIELA